MAHYPPFMNATGLTSKILKKLMAAQTPDRFTGLAKDHGTVTAIRGTFEALKKFADFGAAPPGDEGNGAEEEEVSDTGKGKSNLLPALGVSYQINLVLPKTDDVAVFNAIFKSLRENLLRK